MTIDTKNWKKFGETPNAQFFEIENHILAVLPTEGCTDDKETATSSVDTQLAYLHEQKKKAAIVIFMDPIAVQTGDARKVYQDRPDLNYQVCFALVGGTFFGRAVGSVFLGLSKPRVPTQMFATLEQALAWCRTQINT